MWVAAGFSDWRDVGAGGWDGGEQWRPGSKECGGVRFAEAGDGGVWNAWHYYAGVFSVACAAERNADDFLRDGGCAGGASAGAGDSEFEIGAFGAADLLWSRDATASRCFVRGLGSRVDGSGGASETYDELSDDYRCGRRCVERSAGGFFGGGAGAGRSCGGGRFLLVR